MTEYVFRPSRAGVKSRLYSGRYTLNRGDKPTTVHLGTPDKRIAQKRLRDIIVKAQMEAEGMIAPAAQRDAAAAMLSALVADYVADLRALGRTPKHINDTGKRIARTLVGTGWKRLRDIRADEYTRYRASLTCSAKTAKEYQAAFVAFLNWLERHGRIASNPLARLDRVRTRGRQVRIARAFTRAELARLYAVATPARLLVYQLLTYTGQRRSEVRALTWGDIDLEAGHVLFRAETTKDADKRPIPLHRGLIAALRAVRPAAPARDADVIETFPKHKTLLRDLERAGIARKDDTGRVVHFHSFRKTFQTLGVQSGINQRAAQELLGHSDANLTAKIYTDMPAIGLAAEVEKLPWVTAGQDDALGRTPAACVHPSVQDRFSGILADLVEFSKELKISDLGDFLDVKKWGGLRDSRPIGWRCRA